MRNQISFLLQLLFIETPEEWCKVVENFPVEIPDDYIYDITTDSHTLLVNGMYNHNCCGYSLRSVISMGVQGVQNIPTSAPAKHFDSILNQLANITIIYQNEIAGAIAFSSFDTLLSPFIKEDNLTYEEVKQSMQNFIYSINSNSRMGAEPAFSNITLDLTPPNDLLNEHAVVGNNIMPYTYKDCQKEIDMFNKAFCELMIEGDAKGRPFAYPIPTYNIHERFDWDNPNNESLWEMSGKYGYPYFANFINSDMKPEDARSMCCRLRLDLSELKRRSGGLFGSGDSTGCYDDKTEILTKSGWKYFKDLSYTDEIFTLTKDNNIELHKPDNIMEYNWDGDLLHFKNAKYDLMVTANHMILYDNKFDKKRKFIRADQYSRTKHPIPKSGKWEGQEKQYFYLPAIKDMQTTEEKKNTNFDDKKDGLPISIDLWLKFLGFWIAEGSYDNDKNAHSHSYRVFITQKDRTRELEEILNELPFRYRKEGLNYCITNKQLWSYIKNLGHCYDKFIPDEFKDLSARQLKILYDHLMMGDGSIRKNPPKNTKPQAVYYTTSKRLANDFQELAMKIGYITNIRSRNRGFIHIGGRTHPCVDCYEVSIGYSKYFYIHPQNINKVHYKGKIYCCDVKNHVIMVRRNGFATWCGNSIGNVSLNLSRIAYENKNNRQAFFIELNRCLNVAKDSLEIKRRWLQENVIDSNLIPAFNTYVGTLKNHFSTIGIVGMNEMCENFFDGEEDILTEIGKEFAIEVGNYINNQLVEFQKETGNLYNFEATPAESTAYRLALKDVKDYPDIITRGTKDTPYYTNSCHIPVNKIKGIKETFDHQEDLQILFTGGTVIHIYVNSAISGESAKNIIQTVCNNYKVPYVSISPLNRYCPEHGYIANNVDNCPICNTPVQKLQRITGYLRCVDNFNDGKKAEFNDRVQLNIT